MSFMEMFEQAYAKPSIDVTTLKKGEWYIIDMMGMNVRAKLMSSPKQGKGWKKTVMMDVRGSDVGMYDEMGSVYVSKIIEHYPGGAGGYSHA
jgi:hypothetical protein